jgi:hypothetical protein
MVRCGRGSARNAACSAARPAASCCFQESSAGTSDSGGGAAWVVDTACFVRRLASPVEEAAEVRAPLRTPS